MKKIKLEKILTTIVAILMVIILVCDASKGILTLLNDLLLFAGAYAVYYSIRENDKLWKKI